MFMMEQLEFTGFGHVMLGEFFACRLLFGLKNILHWM